jgi:hypothetical protein
MSTDRTNRWAPCTMQESPIHAWEHKRCRLIPSNKLNNKQWTVIKHRQWRGPAECWKCTGERERYKEINSVPNHQQINRGKAVKTESGRVISHSPKQGRQWITEMIHLSQRGASKTELSHKTEKQTEL